MSATLDHYLITLTRGTYTACALTEVDPFGSVLTDAARCPRCEALLARVDTARDYAWQRAITPVEAASALGMPAQVRLILTSEATV